MSRERLQQKKTKKIKTTRYGCFFKPSMSEDEWVMGESAFLCRKYGMDNGMELPLQIIPMEPKAARTTYLLIGDFTS
jgi:hypothetical protein